MSRLIPTLGLIHVALLALSGCSGPAEATPETLSEAAPVVNPDTGAKAVLGGQVLDEGGMPIAGATVTAFATGDTAVTDANGEYLLAAEARASLILGVSAEGYADSLVSSVLLDAGTTSLGHDVRLQTVASLESISAKGGDAPELDTYGVVAVTVVSLGGTCSATGATLEYFPAPGAKVVYPPFGAGAEAMAEGEAVAAYVVRALPPGVYDELELTGASCEAAAFPVSYRGRSYDGANMVAAGKLTQATLFLP